MEIFHFKYALRLELDAHVPLLPPLSIYHIPMANGQSAFRAINTAVLPIPFQIQKATGLWTGIRNRRNHCNRVSNRSLSSPLSS
jgi:hypothetical protein